MALQSTIGPTGPNDLYVTKNTFYWAVGIVILLIAAISFSMSRNLTRLSLMNHRSDTVTDTGTATTPGTVNETRGTDNTMRNDSYETVNPDTTGATTGAAAGAAVGTTVNRGTTGTSTGTMNRSTGSVNGTVNGSAGGTTGTTGSGSTNGSNTGADYNGGGSNTNYNGVTSGTNGTDGSSNTAPGSTQ